MTEQEHGDDLRLPSETFCAMPWLTLYADTLGHVRPCPLAVGDDGEEAEMVTAPAGIEAAWNSPPMRRMRRDMLAGKRPDACRLCFRDAELGVQCTRMTMNRLFRDRLAAAAAATAPDGSAPLGLVRKLDLFFGNTCNLLCRMCWPGASKGLLEEWAALNGLEPDDPRLAGLRRIDWFRRPDFWERFERLLPGIDRLHFAGGEPFLIPQMFETLERVVAAGRAGQVSLGYSTNLTVLPPRLLALWPHFKAVRVTASLDGIGPVNSYIRHPADWSRIDAHLRLLDDNFDACNLNGLAVNCSVQVANVFRLDELVEYLADGFRHVEEPYLTLVSRPECLDIRVLPPEMKALAAARLRRCASRLGARPLAASLEGIVRHMESADRSDLLPEFRRRCRHQDRNRGQHLPDVVPELAPLLH